MSRRVTIEDVARLAGVTKGTVSSVLNGRVEDARISQQTAERILKAAETLDYRPSAVGRMLARKQADAIGVLFQYGDLFSATSSFIPMVMRGVCEACTEGGVDLMLFTKMGHDSDDIVHALTDGRIDGVLALRDGDDPVIESLAQRQLPTVLFYSRATNQNAAYVDTDNFAGGRLAARHLMQLGHQSVAIVKAAGGSTSSHDRYVGFRDELESEGIALLPENVVHMGSAADDREPVRRLMSRPNPPTGIFCWSDDVAIAVMRIFKDMGLRVPDDVSVVGFDSSDACEHSIPRLTSICQPVAAIAKAATRMLLAQIKGEELEQNRLLFAPNLDVRDSSAPPSNHQQTVDNPSTKRSP